MLTPRDDLYPSRFGKNTQYLPRQDPVIHGDSAQRAGTGLSAEQLADFEKNGFLILDAVFTESEVAALRSESSELLTDVTTKNLKEVICEPNSGAVRSVFRAHKLSQPIEEVTNDHRLTRIAQGLLGDAVYIHQTRVNFKPGFKGTEFYWHSDFETWHVEDGMPRMRALSMSITLTENHADNGPLLLIPGSHKTFVTCTGETPDNHHEKSLRKQQFGVPSDEAVSHLIETNGIARAECKAGSVIVFDCNTVHGSNSNITPDPRANIFVVYNAMANAVIDPFCTQPPRPEHVCTRESIVQVQTQTHG
ncbi:MAG: ectoine hydroxylase [Burkholderiaceae bacterium]|jgi:ectoine hydroxylase|nr:ectoine hydroxylase [Burkholderiaceae bacterium]MDA9884316.1 ectoine hydroxylase [Burkholderiaceae bacterium]MDO7593924.1 ectoine hydroxylase [Burkholderiaceae bacterium]MDO7668005.1 ectoine hydroxylase [Burkholderiaceae bacterium]